MAVKAVTLKITETEQKALNELLPFLKGTWQNARIVMFGSKAKGAPDEESDLDILIALPVDVTKNIRRSIIHKIFEINLLFGTNISALIVSLDEWQYGRLSVLPIHTAVEKEGISL